MSPKKLDVLKKSFIPWLWSFKKTRKHKDWKRGIWAERAAAAWLQMKGYQIKARRYKTPLGEIDLVIQRGSTLIAVEVKARPTFHEGLEAVTPHQQQRILRAMQLYVSHHQNFQRSDLRFDVVVIKPWSWPKHLTHAWGA